MAAPGLFDKPFFISTEDLLQVDCIATFSELCEFYNSKKDTGIDARLMTILSNTYMSYDEKLHTRIQMVDFWESVKQLGLKYEFVDGGVLIYKNQLVQDKFSLHQESISFENIDALFMENWCFPQSTVVEALDKAQDWISQEMVKPHVRVMKEKLEFTDVQIINGLQIIRDRDEDVTFTSLLKTLVYTENAVLNMYVGTGKYAFSPDVKLCLRACHNIYHDEPTQEQFEEQWNRIKVHLMEKAETEKTRADRTEEEKMRAEEEKMRAEEEKMRAEEEKMRAEEEKMRAEEEKMRALRREALLKKQKRKAEEEIIKRKKNETMLEEQNRKAEEQKRKAEEQKRKAEEQQRKAEEEIVQRKKNETMLEEQKRKAEEQKRKAEEQKRKAEEQKRKAEEQKIQALKDFNFAIEVRNEAVEETMKALNREEDLKKENAAVKARAELEKANAEAEKARAEAEKVKAKMLEEQLAKMTEMFEKEKAQLLLQIQQMTGCVRA